ncbi:MAG: hypothetical protein QQW96_18770 [Tychonema bourrellyi B0820]|nr:hypothetical protein [Tychonema bourrellyi B0820]
MSSVNFCNNTDKSKFFRLSTYSLSQKDEVLSGMGHGAWGIGHGAWGIGHGA